MMVPNKYLILITCIIAYFAFTLYVYYNDQKLNIHFLNIGQGDSTLIITPKKYTILIDGGPRDELDYQLSKYLYPLDRTIDMLILTHPHKDHLFGFIKIMDNYKIGSILMTGALYNNILYKEFLLKIKENNIPIIIADSKNDIIIDNNTELDILYPLTSQYLSSYKNLNNSSLVFQLKYKDNKILFTGDIEIEGISILNNYGKNLKSDILKVSHHGSDNGTTPELLDNVAPDIAILSYKIGNKFGHPRPETMDLLEKYDVKICRTKKQACSFNFY